MIAEPSQSESERGTQAATGVYGAEDMRREEVLLRDPQHDGLRAPVERTTGRVCVTEIRWVDLLFEPAAEADVDIPSGGEVREGAPYR